MRGRSFEKLQADAAGSRGYRSIPKLPASCAILSLAVGTRLSLSVEVWIHVHEAQQCWVLLRVWPGV